MRHLTFKNIRKLWCRKVTDISECSHLTPGARWNGDYYALDIHYAIPFWVRSYEAIDDYIDKRVEEDWLYWS